MCSCCLVFLLSPCHQVQVRMHVGSLLSTTNTQSVVLVLLSLRFRDLLFACYLLGFRDLHKFLFV